MKSSIVHHPSSIVCLLTSVFCLLLFAPGCDRINQIDPDQVRSFAADVNDLTIRVDAYQQAATAAINALQERNAIDPNVAKTVLAANADIDKLQATIQSVASALQGAPYSDSGGLSTMLEGARAANAASAPWNPYAAIIAAALTILSTILGIALKKKSAEASSLGLKYQAHKQGVKKTMKDVSISTDSEVVKVEGVLYDNIGRARAVLGVT